jgi:hypothetical protein
MRETERLERETEETRARLEHTLGELRARMSPGQLIDQASNYFRNNSGREYLHNFREEVVHNPMPVALIGAGIAWLAISGTMGRRHNGGNGSMERDSMGRDWGRTAGIAQDLSHGGSGPSGMQRARETAADWTEDASARASTAYDEAIGAARQTTEDWKEEASSTAHKARETMREGMDTARERASHARHRASEMYEHTAGGVRRVAHKAADYGRAARHSFDRDGPLVTFCREQPLLVAGIGVAVGAALAAMIPASRTERQVMGDTSRDVQDRFRDTARSVMGDSESDRQQSRPGEGADESRYGDSTGQRESWQGEASRGDTARTEPRSRESWQGETYREAAADVERGMQQSERASNIETEPRSTPYAEAAEAGAAGTTPVPEEEPKQRT